MNFIFYFVEIKFNQYNFLFFISLPSTTRRAQGRTHSAYFILLLRNRPNLTRALSNFVFAKNEKKKQILLKKREKIANIIFVVKKTHQINKFATNLLIFAFFFYFYNLQKIWTEIEVAPKFGSNLNRFHAVVKYIAKKIK